MVVELRYGVCEPGVARGPEVSKLPIVVTEPVVAKLPYVALEPGAAKLPEVAQGPYAEVVLPPYVVEEV